MNYFGDTRIKGTLEDLNFLTVLGKKDPNTPLDEYLPLLKKDKVITLNEGHIGLSRFSLRHFLIAHNYFSDSSK